jgi:xanthine dehydrogenase accessory factor
VTEADLHRLLADHVERGDSIASAQIVRATGSIPNGVGALMLVGQGGALLGGTVGGGSIEAKALVAAGLALETGESTLFNAKLTETEAGGIGMMCGGQVDIFIKVHAPTPTLLLLGGGHINQCVARLADGMGYRVTVVDDRTEWANATAYPRARVVNALPEDVVHDLGVDAETYIVVATRDRDTPAILAASKTDAAYIGVVASKRKAIQLVKGLADRVDLDHLLPRLHAPVGLSLGGRTPEAIALSILSEIQAHRHGLDATAMRIDPEQLRCYVDKTAKR